MVQWRTMGYKAYRYYDIVYRNKLYEHVTSKEFCDELCKIGFTCPSCGKSLDHQIKSLRLNLRVKVNENNYLNMDTDFVCNDCHYKLDSFKQSCRNHIREQLQDWWGEDGLFTNQVKDGSYHSLDLNIHNKLILHKEWVQYGTEFLPTSIYYAEYNDPNKNNLYKIGISNNIKIRSSIGDGLDKCNYTIIREFSNRYIAAYVEYLIKCKFCKTLSESIERSDIQNIIDLVNNFAITDDVISDLKQLGWNFDDKYLVV